jgi:hypothetical protein
MKVGDHVRVRCGPYAGMFGRIDHVDGEWFDVALVFDGSRSAPAMFATSAKALESIEQRDPIPNCHPAVWDLVLADIGTRDKIGEAKYRTRLQPHNGRDFLRDAYEEALDLVVYLRGAIFERDGK